jgi:hypothetical protein
VFVKGVPISSKQVRHQQREADVNPFLPASVPRLRWHVQGGGWDLLGFELIDGWTADFSPGSPDLPHVAAALEELAAVPCPDVPLLSCVERYAAYAEDAALFDGDALLHTDVNPGNILVGDRAHLVDWAWPTRGAAWVDPAIWVVRLIDAGHSPRAAEELAGWLSVWRDAPQSALTSFARAGAALWAEVAQQAPAAWQQSMARSARLWADYRTSREARPATVASASRRGPRGTR